MAAVSEYAKKNKNRANREIYAWYKSKGICVRCKRTWAAPGRVCCQACLKVKAKEAQKYGGDYNAKKCKERRERLKEQGLCVCCAKPAVKGKVLCDKCARRNAEAQQVKYIRARIAKGQPCLPKIEHNVVYNGQVMNLGKAAKESGIKYNTLLSRIRRGWSEDRLFQPVG